MEKRLFARDVLTKEEYNVLYESMVRDETFWILESGLKNADENAGQAVAREILENEPLEELKEYDLFHILNYNEDYEHIIEKIESACNNKKEGKISNERVHRQD